MIRRSFLRYVVRLVGGSTSAAMLRRVFPWIGLPLALGSCTDSPDRSKRPRKINLGPISRFQAIVTPLYLEKIAIIRDKGGFAAMSLNCTHQDCLVQQHGRSFDAIVMARSSIAREQFLLARRKNHCLGIPCL